jgi:hypothetical protein
MTSEKKKQLNISLSGEEVDLIEALQEKLNKELMMKLSMAQIVKRLIRQASAF